MQSGSAFTIEAQGQPDKEESNDEMCDSCCRDAAVQAGRGICWGGAMKAPVSRFRACVLRSWSPGSAETGKEVESRALALVPERRLGFSFSMAEFLLVFRLRASRRSALSDQVLARALRIVLVTCQSWFGAGRLPRRGIDSPRDSSKR